MNFVGIIIVAIIVLFGLWGMKRGLVRKFFGVLSLVLASLLVCGLLPLTTQFLKEKTPVYDFLTEKGRELVSTELVERAVLNAAGKGSEQLAAEMAAGAVDLSVLDSLSKVEQTRLIKAMPVPGFVQRIIVNFNNSDGYRTLNADGFTQYLVNFVVNLIINILAFFVTMLVVWLIIRGVIGALDLVARLPFIYSANRVGGLVAGLVEGLFAVWLILLIVSMFSGTAAGARLIELINENTFLTPVFEGNVFMRIISSSIAHIM